MKTVRRYHLVDFAAHFQKGFRNHVVSITEVPSLVKGFNSYGCYITYFFYSDEILTYMGSQAGSPTIAGYEGKVWAPFFPLDLDHEELARAQKSARFFAALFLDRWKVDPGGLHIYFSGSKGFHLMLDTRLFGKILPSKSLPFHFAALRLHLARQLPENQRDTVDMAIKDRVRLLRLPNTVHEKSRLYKIPISVEELNTLDPEEIRKLAHKPRPLQATDESGFVSSLPVTANPETVKLVQRIQRQLKRMTRKSFRYRFRHPEDLSHIVFPCTGFQGIWESHIEPGSRNNCAIRLASEFRVLGLTEEETGDKLFEWNERNRIGLPWQELQNVVRSAYLRRFPYRYSCHDETLRRFCPLASFDDCENYVRQHSASLVGKTDSSDG